MASPYWVKQLINKTFSQRFFWAKFSRVPVIGRIIEYALFEDDDIIFLPKTRPIPVNQTIKQQDNLVVPADVADHFNQSANFYFIMEFCICRDSTHCTNYPTDLGCLFFF